MCEDIAGGSDLSAGGTFFHDIQRPFRWVPNVRWRNRYFARNKEAFPCVRPWTQLSASPRIVLFQWKLVVDHIDHAAPRAPRRWMMARPRKGTTRSRGRHGSGCPRGEEYEGSLVRLRCEAAVAAGHARDASMMGPLGLPGSTAGHGRREQAVSTALVWAAGAG